MILMKEILGPHKWEDLPLDHKANAFNLQHGVNIIRAVYARPMYVTSGYRSWAEHKLIYFNMGKTAPKGSKHLICGALDIEDKDKSLKRFLIDHVELLEQANLWCESFDVTQDWVHFQIFPPRSGKRFFIP